MGESPRDQEIRRTYWRKGGYSVHGVVFSFVLTATCASADLATYIQINPYPGAFAHCINHFMLLVLV